MDIQGHESLCSSSDTQRLEAVYGKRRYRAHAILILLILAIALVTLQSDNVLSTKIRSVSSAQSPNFNGDIGSISSFAATKVCANSIASFNTKCENIYAHSDQCHFVLEHCEKSEAGMIHYLKFYFCTLGNARPIAFVLMVSISAISPSLTIGYMVERTIHRHRHCCKRFLLSQPLYTFSNPRDVPVICGGHHSCTRQRFSRSLFDIRCDESGCRESCAR